jgi:hypothetical protein
MGHPLSVIPPLQRGKVLLFLSVLTTAPGIIIWILGADLKTDKAPQGIVSLQLAGDPLVAVSILNSWALKSGTASRVVGLDYTFLLLYSTTLALACIWASGLWLNSAMTELGIWLAWGQWVAGLFNAIQNFLLLRMLGQANVGPPASLATEAARLCSLGKFGLIEAGGLYIAASALNYGLGPRLRFSLRTAK